METKDFKYRRKFRFIGMAIVIAVAASLAVMLLWNWLMPVLFSLPQISFLQAIGLLILSKLLLGGLGKGHRSRYGHPYWRWKYRQKWEQMTDEEKEEFQKRICPGS